MARSAFILGGTGLVGQAVVRRLAEGGWDVVAASRGEREVPSDVAAAARVVTIDRTADDLAAAVGDRVDVLVDVVPFRREDAEQLLALKSRVGSLIAISSAAVYADAKGRTLDEATDLESFPELPVPISERQATVAPGDETYATRKAAIERALLGQRTIPATVVRPGAIHGPGDLMSREWYFAKRALDGRRAVVLAHRGASRFQTTAAENLAELVRLAAQRPGTRVFNCGDPDAPTVVEIGRAIAAALDHEWAEVLLSGPPLGSVGDHPWGVPRPFVLDTTAAELELGYRPVTTYAAAAPATCEWLRQVTAGREWQEALPKLHEHPGELFDYAAEDEFLASLTGG